MNKIINLKKHLIAIISASFVIFLLFFIAKGFFPSLPDKEKPIIFYSNQCRDDLRLTVKKAICSAKKSIFISIFALSDKKTIQALNEKASQGINIEILCTKSMTKRLSRKLSDKVQIKGRNTKGLMHQKILIIDDQMVLIGSANLTTTSLIIYDNLIIGCHSKELAKLVKNKLKSSKNTLERGCWNPNETALKIDNQDIECFILPEDKDAIHRLIDLLEKAKKSIKVAMFTWTNPLLAKAVIDAHKRGVSVHVLLDYFSSKGASKKITRLLIKEGVKVGFSQGLGFLHHKFACIDNSTLINGSANWTKAAFTKNCESFLIIHNLSPKQKKFARKFWRNLSLEADWKFHTTFSN